jgi:hypothetical protein
VIGGLALLALLYGRAHHQVSSRRAQVATLTARAQKATEEASRLTPYTSFIALREARTQAVSQLVDSRFDWAHAFHELGRVLPADVSISSLDGSIGSGAPASLAATPSSSATSTSASSTAAGASVTSATPPGSIPSFTLTGCASSQAEVAIALDRLRLIDGVEEVNLQSSTKAGGTSGTAGGGGCAASDPSFTVRVAFSPLPDQATTKSSTSRFTSAKAGGQ